LFNWHKALYYLLPPLLTLIVVFFVNFKTDISAFIIAGDNAEEILLASEMQSGALSRRYLLSVGAEGEARVPKEFIHSFQGQLKKIDGVLDVWSPGKQGDVAQVMQTLYSQYGSALYSLDSEQELEQLFSPGGLEQQAKLLKKSLLSPQGAMVKKIALQDPLLLTLNGFKGLSGQMQQVTSQDNKYRNLILETAAAGLDASEQGRIQTAIKTVFNQLNQSTNKEKNYQLDMTGVAVFAVATQSLIQGDIVKVSALSTIALLL